MRETGPLPPNPAPEDEDDSSATEYQPVIDLHPELSAGRGALVNSVGPPPPQPPAAVDEDDPPPPPSEPVSERAESQQDAPSALAVSTELPRPLNRGMSLAPPPVNLASSLPPPAVMVNDPASFAPPKQPRVIVLPPATRPAPVSKPMSPPPIRAAPAPAAAPLEAVAAPPTAPASAPASAAPVAKADGLEGMLAELQHAMKRDVDKRTEQRKVVEERVVAERVARQSRRATQVGGAAPGAPPPDSSRDDNSLALLWEECESATINDDERAMMLDERSKLVAEVCATERTFATMVKQALRVYFDPLFVSRALPAVAPVQRCLSDIDGNKDVLALVGALQLIAKSSERLAARMDEMRANLAKARGVPVDNDDELLLADAPIGKLLLRDSDQLFELCSTLCVQQLPAGAAVLQKCEATNNDVAKYHAEQRNKSFALRDYSPLRSVALPAERLVQWLALLRELVRCTPHDHADYNDTADIVAVLDAQLANDSVDPAAVYTKVTKVADAPAAAPPAPLPATRVPQPIALAAAPPMQPPQPQGVPQGDGDLSPRRPMRGGVALMPGMQMDELGAQRARLQKQPSAAGPPPVVVAAPATRGPPPPMRRGPPPAIGLAETAPPPIAGGPPPPLGAPQRVPPPIAAPVRGGLSPFAPGAPPERPLSPEMFASANGPAAASAAVSTGLISSITVALEPGRPLLRCPVQGCVKAYYAEKDIMLHYKLRHPNEPALDLEAVIAKAESDARKQLAKEEAKRAQSAQAASTPDAGAAAIAPSSPRGAQPQPGHSSPPGAGGPPPGGVASPFAGGPPPGGVASPFAGGPPPGSAVGGGPPFGGGPPPGGVASPFGGGPPPGGVASPFGGGPPPGGVASPFGGGPPVGGAARAPQPFGVPGASAPSNPPVRPPPAGRPVMPLSLRRNQEPGEHLFLSPRDRLPTMTRDAPLPPPIAAELSAGAGAAAAPALIEEEVYGKLQLGPKPDDVGSPRDNAPPAGPPVAEAPMRMPPPGGSFRAFPPPLASVRGAGAPPPIARGVAAIPTPLMAPQAPAPNGGSFRGPPPNLRGPALPPLGARRAPAASPFGVPAADAAPPSIPPHQAQPPPSMPSARRIPAPIVARRAEPAAPPQLKAPVSGSPPGRGTAAFFGLDSADYSPMVTQAMATPVDADGIRLSITCGTRNAAAAKLKAASAAHAKDEVLGAFACTWNDSETFAADEVGEVLLTDKSLVFLSARGQTVAVAISSFADARQLDDTTLQIRRIGHKPVLLKRLTPPAWAYGGSVDALEELASLLSQFQTLLTENPDVPPPFHREWMAQCMSDAGLVDAMVRVSTLAIQVTFTGGQPQKRYSLGDLERWAAQGEKASVALFDNVDHLRIACPDASEIVDFLSQCSTCVAARLGLLADEPEQQAAQQQQQPEQQEQQEQPPQESSWQEQAQPDWQPEQQQQDWQQQQQNWQQQSWQADPSANWQQEQQPEQQWQAQEGQWQQGGW
jgi:hypothetical protein